jgi:hypothetical protein
MRPLFLFFSLLSPFALAQETFLRIDGENLPVPEVQTAQQLAAEIVRLRSAMFDGTGAVGQRTSLETQGGSDIIRRSLNDYLAELVVQSEIIKLGDRHWEIPIAPEKREAAESARVQKEENIRKKVYQRNIYELAGMASDQNLMRLREMVANYDQYAQTRRNEIEKVEVQLGVRSPPRGVSRPATPDAAEKKSLEARLDYLERDHGQRLLETEPYRKMLRYLEGASAQLVRGNNALFDGLPKALSGTHAPTLSPKTYEAIRARFKTDPEYAKHFQRELALHPETPDRKGSKTAGLNLGSIQAAELFLAAGDALPAHERIVLKGQSRIWPDAVFDMGSLPVFVRLRQDYGVEMGPNRVDGGLKFEGIPKRDDLALVASANSPGLSQAVAKALRPLAPGERRTGRLFEGTPSICEGYKALVTSP